MADNVGAATALVGLSVFQIHNLYVEHAGSLEDARRAGRNDPVTAQRLRDADILAGALTVMVGGTVARFTRSSTPFWLAVTAFGSVAVYYHMALSREGV